MLTDNTGKTHGRSIHFNFNYIPEIPDQGLNFTMMYKKHKVEKSCPHTILKENRENFALIKKFG